jgi:hypothetical protein
MLSAASLTLFHGRAPRSARASTSLPDEKTPMRDAALSAPLTAHSRGTTIGQEVRWRHPRRALALGWFHVIGPGPFEVIAVLDRRERGLPLSLLIRTPSGNQEVEAVLLAPVDGTCPWASLPR